MNTLIRFFLTGLAIMLIAYLLPEVVFVKDYYTALLVALLLAIVNAVVKPILIVFTIPITVLTLGLFLLVINALMILLVDHFVDGFHVKGFWWALAFSLLLSVFNSFFSDITADKEKER